jgi:hypothetical protein
VAIPRDLEAVVLREPGVFLVAAGFGQGGLVFLVVDIGDAFEEEEREDVGLEIGGVNRSAQEKPPSPRECRRLNDE